MTEEVLATAVALGAVIITPLITLVVMKHLAAMHRATLKHLADTQLYGGTPAALARKQLDDAHYLNEREQRARIEEQALSAEHHRKLLDKAADEEDKIFS